MFEFNNDDNNDNEETQTKNKEFVDLCFEREGWLGLKDTLSF